MAALALGEVAGWPVLGKHGNVKIRNGKVVLAKAENMRAATAGVIAYRVIFARAERGLGLDLFLRMQRGRPPGAPAGEGRGQGQRPRADRPVFRRAEPAAPASGETATAGPQSPPPLTVDGQVYE